MTRPFLSDSFGHPNNISCGSSTNVKQKRNGAKYGIIKDLLTAFIQTSGMISSTHGIGSGTALHFGGCEFFVSPIKWLVPMVT
jgi:hypothetical protein